MTEVIDAKPARKGQIRPPVEAAIQQIVATGCTIGEAAQSQGMKARSLAIALRKGHVSARWADVKREWLNQKTQRAWVTVVDLAEGAASEDARLRAAKVILEAAGELTPREQARPSSGVAVQIIIGTGADRREVRLSDGASNGVIEAPAWEPAAVGDDE